MFTSHYYSIEKSVKWKKDRVKASQHEWPLSMANLVKRLLVPFWRRSSEYSAVASILSSGLPPRIGKHPIWIPLSSATMSSVSLQSYWDLELRRMRPRICFANCLVLGIVHGWRFCNLSLVTSPRPMLGQVGFDSIARKGGRLTFSVCIPMSKPWGHYFSKGHQKPGCLLAITNCSRPMHLKAKVLKCNLFPDVFNSQWRIFSLLRVAKWRNFKWPSVWIDV